MSNLRRCRTRIYRGLLATALLLGGASPAHAAACPDAGTLRLPDWSCPDSSDSCYERLRIYGRNLSAAAHCLDPKTPADQPVGGSTFFNLPARRPPIIFITVPGLYRTASSFEVSDLSHTLSDLGYGMIHLTLPGHGLFGKNASRTSFRDWKQELNRAIDMARSTGARVVLVGESLGGALGFAATVERPGDIAGAILFDPALQVRPLLANGACALKHLGTNAGNLWPLPFLMGVDRSTADDSNFSLGCEVQKITDDLASRYGDGRSSCEGRTDDRSARDRAYASLSRPVLIFGTKEDSVVEADEFARLAQIRPDRVKLAVGRNIGHEGNLKRDEKGWEAGFTSVSRLDSVIYDTRDFNQLATKATPETRKALDFLDRLGEGPFIRTNRPRQVQVETRRLERKLQEEMVGTVEKNIANVEKAIPEFDAVFGPEAGFHPERLSAWLNGLDQDRREDFMAGSRDRGRNLGAQLEKCAALGVPACIGVPAEPWGQLGKLAGEISAASVSETNCAHVYVGQAFAKAYPNQWRTFDEFKRLVQDHVATMEKEVGFNHARLCSRGSPDGSMGWDAAAELNAKIPQLYALRVPAKAALTAYAQSLRRLQRQLRQTLAREGQDD